MRNPNLALSHALVFGLGALLCGCSSTADTDEEPQSDEVRVTIDPPPDKTIELDPFEHEWEDLERNRQGVRSPYDVARWVTERHNAVLRCLREEPVARVQATEILEEILKRVPDSSQDRRLLARIRFSESAYWFRVADVLAWDMDRLRNEKTATKASKKLLTTEEVNEFLDAMRPRLTEANEALRAAARAARKQVDAYMKQRPDDRAVLDWKWKLHFYTQDYQEAQRWLRYLLDEWPGSDKEPVFLQYQHIEKRLGDYLANLTLGGGDDERGSTVLPWKDERGRMLRKNLHDDAGW